MNYFAEKIIGLVLCTVFGFTVAVGAPDASGAPSSTIALAPISVQPYLIEPTTTTSSTIYIDPYSSACEQFSALAVNLGWPANQRTVLESIMWRESNCKSWAFNPTDTAGGSRGLLQINGAHTKPTDWNPAGWLQSQYIGVVHTDDLFNAELNLRAGWVLYQYAERVYGDGWQPWAATRDRD